MPTTANVAEAAEATATSRQLRRLAAETHRNAHAATHMQHKASEKTQFTKTLKPQPHRKILHNSDGSSCIIGSTIHMRHAVK